MLKLVPRISEQTYQMSEDKNTYVFMVPTSANKLDIKQAVEEQFQVTVSGVRTANQFGKTKRTIRKGGKQVTGSRSDFKKAYITLKSGDKIKVFGEGQ